MEKFKGVFTALITPFSNGAVGYHSLRKLIQFQLDNGIHGFVVNGTTGESPTLSEHEQEQVFLFVESEVANAVPIVMGTGTNSTKSTIEASQRAKRLGADAALVVVPYYNKPTQDGLIAHYSAVAKNSEIPVIAYNVPSRTITKIEAETLAELAHIPGLLGVKEASGDLEYLKKAKSLIRKDFLFTSGDDGTFYDFMMLGGHGIISVCSHILPKQMVKWYEASRAQDASSKDEFKSHLELINSLYVESNPIPIKFAAHRMGLIKSFEMRLPLTPLAQKHHQTVVANMTRQGLL